MQGLREFGNALFVAFLSIGLILGALSISLVEFIPETAPTATYIPLSPPPPVTATDSPPPTSTPAANAQLPIPTQTNTVPAPAYCPPQPGWMAIQIRAGDTLESLAAQYGTSPDTLRAGNCLLSDNLPPGTNFYVPAVATSTVRACIPGAAAWVNTYRVKPGDTLFSIAINHYTSLSTFKTVNCRVSDVIFPGELLWVPNVATRTPLPTLPPGVTASPLPTDPLTETALPFTVTIQPSVTHTATKAPTQTTSPTATVTPTAFPTSTP